MENDIKDIIANFRAEIEGFSKEQLIAKREELRNAVSKMILDSDLMVKAAIVETHIQELEKEEN